jgi:hypothetical protein
MQLAEHAHLLPQVGCFKGIDSNKTLILRECGIGAGERLESKQSDIFYPMQLSENMTTTWMDRVNKLLFLRRDPIPYGATEELRAALKGEDDKQQSVLPPIDAGLNTSFHAVQTIQVEIAKGNYSLPKIPVVVWPYLEFGVGNAESFQIEENGINESPFLELSTSMDNFDPNVVWVGDTGYAYAWNTWCLKFGELVKEAKQKRHKLGLPLQWPIYVRDFWGGACMLLERSFVYSLILSLSLPVRLSISRTVLRFKSVQILKKN